MNALRRLSQVLLVLTMVGWLADTMEGSPVWHALGYPWFSPWLVLGGVAVLLGTRPPRPVRPGQVPPHPGGPR